MRQPLYFIKRRITESIVISLLSSLIPYFIIWVASVEFTRANYILTFGLSAICFLALHYVVLTAHFRAVKLNISVYMKVNSSILCGFLILDIMAHKFLSSNLYTALFGYTKSFRQLLDVSGSVSSAIFWGLYLLTILSVFIIPFCFNKKYRYGVYVKWANIDNGID